MSLETEIKCTAEISRVQLEGGAQHDVQWHLRIILELYLKIDQKSGIASLSAASSQQFLITSSDQLQTPRAQISRVPRACVLLSLIQSKKPWKSPRF